MLIVFFIDVFPCIIGVKCLIHIHLQRALSWKNQHNKMLFNFVDFTLFA